MRSSKVSGVINVTKKTNVLLFCVTAIISLSFSAEAQETKKVKDIPEARSLTADSVEKQNSKDQSPVETSPAASPFSMSLGNAGVLFQSAADLRAASESLAQFGESLQKVSENISGTSEAVAEHLAKMSSGFDPLGLQNAFKTVQLQSEVIRVQQELIVELQQKEIQRLRRENRQLKMASKAGKSETGKAKKKRTQP